MKEGDEYTCANCGESFLAGWDDEEAWAESDKNGFANVPKADMCTVCDDCYTAIMNPPANIADSALEATLGAS